MPTPRSAARSPRPSSRPPGRLRRRRLPRPGARGGGPLPRARSGRPARHAGAATRPLFTRGELRAFPERALARRTDRPRGPGARRASSARRRGPRPALDLGAPPSRGRRVTSGRRSWSGAASVTRCSRPWSRPCSPACTPATPTSSAWRRRLRSSRRPFVTTGASSPGCGLSSKPPPAATPPSSTGCAAARRS